MTITIITVSYNAEKSIRDTLQSVLNQSYKKIEYIIIDGASTDNTLEIITSYKNKIAHIISEPDKGLYDAMNKGIKLSTGDVIGFLNADDIFANNSIIQKIADTFTNDTDAIYSDLAYVNHELNKQQRLWIPGEYHHELWHLAWSPPHPTFYAKKDLYDRYGNFDLSHQVSADYELLFRFIYKEKINVKYLAETTVLMRTGGVSNSSWKNIIQGNREIFRTWSKHHIPLNKTKFIFAKIFNRLSQKIKAL